MLQRAVVKNSPRVMAIFENKLVDTCIAFQEGKEVFVGKEQKRIYRGEERSIIPFSRFGFSETGIFYFLAEEVKILPIIH